jgi:hypothetical protein
MEPSDRSHDNLFQDTTLAWQQRPMCRRPEVSMADVLEIRDRLTKVFESAFRVEDIAESLVSFDAVLPAAETRQILEGMKYRVAGVREAGVISGWVPTSALSGGSVGDHRREFDPEEVVSGEASLSQAIRRLPGHDRLFVNVLGKVGGIITWTDLHKPPVRMWLFGMVTLIEMAFTRMIDSLYPDDSWTGIISEGRLRKARSLLAERQRRGESGTLRLVDCLQLSDKGQVLVRDEDARRILEFESRKEGERAVRRLSSLRDSLAHSQDIVTEGWDFIVRIAERVDDILRVSSTFPDLRRSSRPGSEP